MRKYSRASASTPTPISKSASAGKGSAKLPRDVQKACKWAAAEVLLDKCQELSAPQFPNSAESLHIETKAQSVYIMGGHSGALGLPMHDANDGRPVFHPTFGHKPWTAQPVHVLETACQLAADDCADAAANVIMQYADEIGEDSPVDH